MKGTDVRPEILRPFDPRHVPLPAPAPDICDAPTVTICVNSEWWSHLDGMISRLLYRDAWQGTNDEIDRAIESIQQVLAVGKADPMGCCCGNSGALTRYNENGELEISYDNGATWQPYPQGDPRMTGRTAPPIPGPDGDDKKCAAAASAEEFIKQNFIDELETGQGYAAVYDALIALLAIIALTGIGLLVAALVGAVITAGITVVKAAFTSEVWTAFRCILYCRISADGSFTKEAWEGVKADILDQFTGVVSAVLYNWVNSVGPIGLTNSARSGFVATADCTSCDCPEACPAQYEIHDPAESGEHGEIVSIDGLVMTARAGNIVTTGYSYIEIWSPVLGDCCKVMTVNALPGFSIHSVVYIPCGTPYAEENWTGDFDGQCAQLLQIQCDQANAEVEITFEEC